MLECLNDFREKLDDVMLKCMHNRVVIYGYDSYTGRFLKWYASYYHGIEVDYLVSEDMSVGQGYDLEIFRPSVFDFGYKDIRNSVVWLAQPLTKELKEKLEVWGYEAGITYFDFYKAIYGTDIYAPQSEDCDIFHRRKEGKRDIQFIEYLEYKYGCNFLQRIERDDFGIDGSHGSNYSCSTQKELFPILDRCHVQPSREDKIFDFGCGKGGALVSFLDYGFSYVGGVEYEPSICDVAKDNFKLLGIDDVELICDNALNVMEPLDKYNWFFTFNYFDKDFLAKVMSNIKESYLRNKRKIHFIFYVAQNYEIIEQTGIFRLVNQFTAKSRQRVVGIFETFD